MITMLLGNVIISNYYLLTLLTVYHVSWHVYLSKSITQLFSCCHLLHRRYLTCA